mmetsp:Transcript_49735/g.101560  ORF Transcript_49735/g.101560 Transcript_49735/m.101560 type:complete len:282 (-) Transcript_49735:141-986(-)
MTWIQSLRSGHETSMAERMHGSCDSSLTAPELMAELPFCFVHAHRHRFARVGLALRAGGMAWQPERAAFTKSCASAITSRECGVPGIPPPAESCLHNAGSPAPSAPWKAGHSRRAVHGPCTVLHCSFPAARRMARAASTYRSSGAWRWRGAGVPERSISPVAGSVDSRRLCSFGPPPSAGVGETGPCSTRAAYSWMAALTRLQSEESSCSEMWWWWRPWGDLLCWIWWVRAAPPRTPTSEWRMSSSGRRTREGSTTTTDSSSSLGRSDLSSSSMHLRQRST